MPGRWVLVNPWLVSEIKIGIKLDKRRLLKGFHDKIYNDYRSLLSGDINVLYKMKGLWS